MKILVLANQKGGVGKTAVATQLAYYFAEQRKLRVLFADLDHQGNATNAITGSGLASVADFNSAQLFEGMSIDVSGKFVLIPASSELTKLEKQGLGAHNVFATHLQNFLDSVADSFDVCILDTNPNPDIRMTAALIVADYVLSPIQLNQEAVDGIGALNRDINNVKSKLNEKLNLIGILPNLVENTPFQKDNLKQLVEHVPKLLLQHGNGQFAFIPTRTAIAEAQAANVPVWKIPKTSARTAWAEIKPVFETIALRMELPL